MSTATTPAAIAVDIGGTFTDLALRYPDGSTRTSKAATTPSALSDGVVDAIRNAAVPGNDVDFFVHGTTAGLNALLEQVRHRRPDYHAGVPRCLDEIGRANRPAMYDLYYHRPEPLVAQSYALRCESGCLGSGRCPPCLWTSRR